jgi:predicted CopG family antitoxin
MIKTISIDKTLWQKAKEKARENCQSLSAVIRKLLKEWLKK